VEGCKLSQFGHGIQQKKIRSLSQVEGYEGQFTFFKKCPNGPKKLFLTNKYGDKKQ
jgi:hypothetical protein